LEPRWPVHIASGVGVIGQDFDKREVAWESNHFEYWFNEVNDGMF